MNLVLAEAEEIQGGQLRLTGHRAQHLLEILRVTPGDTVRLGVVGGPKGQGRVLTVEQDAVVLDLALAHERPEPPLLELVLALPRPIMLQRILKQATVMGLRRLHLIRSNRVEKSFFASPVLAPDKVRALLLEGMEQAMDTWLPEVRVYRQFKPFVEDVLPTLPGPGLIAHPGVDRSLAEALVLPVPPAPLKLAIGPEGGWTDYEVDAFVRAGFIAFGMGRRILHVDTAVVALMAQLELLAQLRERAQC